MPGSAAENGAATTPPNLTLKCQFIECLQSIDFPTQSALQKHIEKTHTKPYTCKVPNCKHPHFGDKSGLERHKREVHSSQNFLCPISSCKRHTRGFNRAYNLVDHTKRCHSHTSRPSRAALLPRPSPSRSAYLESEDRSEDTMDEPMSPDSVASGGTAIGERSEISRLLERLEASKKMRDDLDKDIQAMERTVEIFRSQ